MVNLSIYLEKNEKGETMLLFDELDNRNIIGQEFDSMLLKTKKLSIISPYISSSSWNPQEILQNNPQIESIRILCDLENPSCNPQTIRLLADDSRILIKYMSRIHAKVYIFDADVLVTSANFTPNGMDEGLIEAGSVENDVETANKWYDKLWSAATPIPNLDDEFAWDQLNQRWKISRAKKMQVVLTENEKPHILDLLSSGQQFDQIAFCLWYDSDDIKTSHQNLIDSDEDLKALSKDISWEFFVDGYSENEKEASELKRIDNKCAICDDKTLVNIKIKKTDYLPSKSKGVVFFLSKSMKKRIWGKKNTDNKWEICSIYQNLNEINTFTLANKAKERKMIDLLLDKLKDEGLKEEWDKCVDDDLGYISFADMQKFLGFSST